MTCKVCTGISKKNRGSRTIVAASICAHSRILRRKSSLMSRVRDLRESNTTVTWKLREITWKYQSKKYVIVWKLRENYDKLPYVKNINLKRLVPYLWVTQSWFQWPRFRYTNRNLKRKSLFESQNVTVPRGTVPFCDSKSDLGVRLFLYVVEGLNLFTCYNHG